MESNSEPKHCYTLYRPGDLDISDLDLQSVLFPHRGAMEEGLRRLLMNRGVVGETSDFGTVSTVLAAHVLEIHGRLRRDTLQAGGLSTKTFTEFNGTQTNLGSGFDAVVEVDMNHPEFYEFRKWLYAKVGLPCDRSIRTAINLFDPLIAQQFAAFLKINLERALFVVKPFDQFEAKSHTVPFTARTSLLLGRNMDSENPVNTVWLFGEHHELNHLELPPREKALLEELRWRGLSK